ncbi:MAG: SH3 domain-containing protein [Anaerolineaceae bacterium]|nr:SH3 domain-containing protein [Anaerolineaceae bacterium]
MRRYTHWWVTLAGLLLALVLLPGMGVQAEYGINWSATFYTDPNLTGTPTSVTGINGINFNWGAGAPIVNGVTVLSQTDQFSARFTSVQTFVDGTYEFVAASDDGIRIFIDGVVVLDQFIGRALTTDTFTRTMTAGSHTLTVEYFEGIDQAIVQFQWFLQGTSTTPQPGITPSPVYTAVPALTVQVVNVRGLSLRTGPYLGASLIGVARPGTAYTPIARNNDEGTYTWFKITLGDKTGWVSGRYLEITGDPNSVPVETTIFQQLDNPTSTGVMGAPRSVMNFRVRPSQRTTRLSQIPWGGEVEILGRTIQGGNNFWFLVRYEGVVGWIYAPYVSIYGDINLVQVY